MFCAYGPGSPLWSRERKYELVKSLRFLLESRDWSLSGMEPYVELVGERVFVRRLNHLSDENLEDLVRQADGVYLRVMK